MKVRPITWFFGLFAVGLMALWSCPVQAQSIAINKTSQSTFIATPDGNQYSHPYTPSTSQMLWVNKSECIQNLYYYLSITATGIQGLPLEVWAAQTGTDCSSQANRVTSAVCWKVYADSASNGTYSLRIPVRNVVGQNKSLNGSTSVYLAQEQDCDAAALSVPSGGVGVTLSVYVYSGLTTGTPTYSDSWDQFGFDLVGPNPPVTVGIGIADSELHVSWSAVLDSDRSGYKIYCEPADSNSAGGSLSVPGTGGSMSADASADVTDAGENASCPSSKIVADKQPPSDISPKGAATTITATDGYAHGVQNDTNYACAVSVADVMRNEGPLSTVVCGTPREVNDFFSQYRSMGGKAGGGFCAVKRPRSGFGATIALASLAILAVGRRRRREKIPTAKVGSSEMAPPLAPGNDESTP